MADDAGALLVRSGLVSPNALDEARARVAAIGGTLGEQLETTAEYFEQELDFRITRFTNLFEPAVIIFMGVIVGFVAIALVSAMYGIFRQVKV